MTGTGGLKRLNKNFVLNYPIFVPPMEEQKLIVQRIQQEYEIVEANKKLISIFEQKIKDKLSEVWGE
jgi:type I restriction enzyme M protein